MLESLIDFYSKSNGVTLFVLILLAVYFIALNWVFYYRYFSLGRWVSKESSSLEALLMGAAKVSDHSYLSHFIKASDVLSRELLDLGMFAATKESTKGLSFLSVVASTSPFIGLFGTVVSILDTFDHIGQASGTMTIIAAGVSDALIATAAGIFVAIFSYSYHQMLKRRSYELNSLIRMQSDALLSRKI